ncbi:MAG: secretin N-terminal domain-containing protein, partial [Planctomycetaceae bacterium]
RQQGIRALGEAELADSLGFSDDQKQKIAALLEERDAARRELSRDISDEDREKFDADWEGKIAGVLTAEQQQSWQQRLGPPLGGDAESAQASAAPSASAGGAPAASPPPTRAAFDVVVPNGAAPVASFTTTAPAGTGRESASESSGSAAASGPHEDVRLSFNFRYAPWDVVLQRFADIAGLTLDLKDVPPGTFNHYDQKEYTITEALDVINSYLLRRGYVLVRGDSFLVSLNIDPGIPPNLVPTIDASELLDRGRYELLNVVFPLPGANVTEVAAEVDKLKGPQGTVVGMTATNSLIVTDIGINLRRIHKLIANMAPGSEDMIFRPYVLSSISAVEAELLIKQMLGVSTGVANVSSTSSRGGDSGSRFDFFRSRERDSDRGSQAATPAVNLSRARIVADERTNRLLATASPSEHRIIEDAIKTIDVEATGSFLSKKPYMASYSVTNSDAREVTKSIDAIMPGIVVNEDGRNGLIHIMATPDQHEKVRDLIHRLDGAGGGSQVAVIPLSNMDPSLAVVTLQGMFMRESTNAPTIQADLVGRQVMVRGTETQILQIRQILTDLGEDGTGTGRTNRGPVRTFNLSSRDPAEVLPILEQMWKARTGSSIRVVNPPAQSRGGPRVLDGQPAVGSEPPAEAAPPATKEAEGAEQDRLGAGLRRRFASDQYAVSVETEPVDAEQPEGAAKPQAAVGAKSPSADRFPAVEEPVSPVTIQVTGGDLMLISQDQAALDEMERMLEDVLHAIPPRTTWTVIPLQSADATEAAAMLEQLFPDSTVSNVSGSSSGLLGTLTSGVTSFGSSVGQMTGLNSLGTGPQTLRIIPEVRLNALFVSGPSYRVDEVRQMLEVLDASGLTDSLRDRVPRMIPVRYADVSEVYEIVKSVYEPEMQSKNNAGANPAAGFAAMFGGGGRGGRGGGNDESTNGQDGPQVTLGVDRNSSALIVSADESTFGEIEQLVASIDGAAREARRTVQVLSLQNVNASTVQTSLSALMPKVTVSTTSSSPRSSSSSSTSSSSDSSEADALRQRMEFFRRMREGGSGGDSSSGRGGGGGDSSSGGRSGNSFGSGSPFGGRGFGDFGGRSFGGFGGFGGRGGDSGGDRGRGDRGR